MLQVRTDVPVPKPAAGEALVRVSACGVNNTDLNTRTGWYGRPSGWTGGLAFPRIQGAGICGRVAEVGHAVDVNLVGRRVLVDPWIRGSQGANWRDHLAYLGSEVDGGFAEYCAVPVANVVPVESALSDAELATFPCAWSTAEHMLTRVDLTAGERIAVPGASGGVGSALVQLAKLRGAHVTAIAGSAKTNRVHALGADVVLARETPDVPAAAVRDGGLFDVVADVVGGSDVPGWWRSLRRGGRYVCCGAIAGPQVELDLRTLYLNDLELIGATAYRREVFLALVDIIDSGAVHPHVAATYPLQRIHEAQEAFAAKEHVGSIVITL
ncbi:MAG: zinc-binding dehydrogenase [Dermatophilaceae bacterium]